MATLSEREVCTIIETTSKELRDYVLSIRKKLLEQGLTDKFSMCIELDELAARYTEDIIFAKTQLEFLDRTTVDYTGD